MGALQSFIDEYGYESDYIHGIGALKKLCLKENTLGFILPAIKKESLFETVIKDGALCRKSFSMGEAFEKRFYIEAKRIR